MDLTLLIQLCGIPLLVVLALSSLILTGFACYLVFSAKSESLLVAFLPLTILPAIAAMVTLFISTLASIGIQLDPDSTIAVDSALVFQMNLVPLLLGLLASAAPAVITVLGRWMIVWKQSGIVLFAAGDESESSELIEPEDWAAKETDEYIDQLVRPR